MFLAFQITIYQWLVPLIALFFILRIFKQFKKGHRLLFSTVLWIAFWLTLSLLAIVPDLVSDSIAVSLGFKDNVNAVIFVMIGFLFLMTYYMSSMLEKLEKQLTELVRQMALEKQNAEDEKNALLKDIEDLKKETLYTQE